MNSVDCRDIARRLIPDKLQSSHGKYDKYFSPFRDDGHKAGLTVYADGVKDHGGNGDYWKPEEFIAALLGTDAAGAREWLGSDTVIERKPRKSEQGPPSEAWQKVAEIFIGDTQRRLWESPAVLDYLRKERGLTDDTIRQAKLGYNPVYSSMRCEGDELHAAPGIVIPWYGDDQLYAVRIRLPVGSLAAVTGHDPSIFGGDKYKSLTGSRQRAGLYNADAIQPGQPVLVVEGEFDTLIASQTLPFAVVTRGSAGDHKNISKKWLNRMHAARPVYLLLDADNAGKQAQESLRKALGDCVSLALPTGKDATEFILNGGNLGAIVADVDQVERSHSYRKLAWNARRDELQAQYIQFVEAKRARDREEKRLAEDERKALEESAHQKLLETSPEPVRGWFDSAEIPKAWLSWLLHLYGKRSTVVVARDLQRARFNGNLPEVFSIADFEAIYPGRYKRQTISAALEDLKYVRVVYCIENTDSIYPKQRGHKNTKWYKMTTLSAPEAAAFIRPRLEEKAFENMVMPSIDRLLAQMAVSTEDRHKVAGVFRAALDRQQSDLIEIARESLSEISKDDTKYEELQQAVIDARSAHYAAQRTVDREMSGWQGWQGWEKELSNHEYLQLPESITSANDLRLEMLRSVVEDQSNHNRSDLAHLLAITSQALGKLYSELGIKTRANYESVAVDHSNLIDLKRSVKKAAREIRGKLVNLKVQVAGESGIRVVPVAQMEQYFTLYGENIESVEAEYRVASTLYYHQESAEKPVESAEKTDSDIEQLSQVEKPEKRKSTPRKPKVQFYPSDQYRPEFLFAQMAMVVKLVSRHTLTGSAGTPIIRTTDGQSIQCDDLRSVALWVVGQHETMELSKQDSSIAAYNSRYKGGVAS